jgi:hypothetical protein
MKRILLFTVIGVVAAFGLASCNDETPKAEPRQMKVRMTDSPGNYAALNMTITGVEAYHESQGWIQLSSNTHAVNVASLTNGSEVELANKYNMQAGHYTRVKVKFGGTSSLVVNATGSGSGVSFNLIWTVPQEVEVVIDKQIDDNNGANILLDFDVASSIVESGSQYTIHPVITYMDHENTGVKGHVTGASTAAVVFTGNGHTYSGYINGSGYFTVRGMAAGTYNCTIYKNSETNEQHQVNNVVVTDGQFYQMGEISL